MFKRDTSLLKQRQLNNKYSELVNKDNIETITRFQLILIFRNAPKIEKETYLHNVIESWWKTKEDDYKTLSKLKRILSKTNITLNIMEQEELLLIEERVFSVDRHIKDIGVNIKLSRKEQVGIKYTDAKMFVEKDSKLSDKLVGDLMVSNRRIIFVSKTMHSFSFKDIQVFDTTNYGFKFLTDGTWYVLRIHDQKTLNVTMLNIISKKNKALLKRGGEDESNKKTFL